MRTDVFRAEHVLYRFHADEGTIQIKADVAGCFTLVPVSAGAKIQIDPIKHFGKKLYIAITEHTKRYRYEEYYGAILITEYSNGVYGVENFYVKKLALQALVVDNVTNQWHERIIPIGHNSELIWGYQIDGAESIREYIANTSPFYAARSTELEIEVQEACATDMRLTLTENGIDFKEL